MSGGWYVLEGRDPVQVNSVEEWATRFEDKSKRVAQTFVGDVSVSTVFLGLDHAFGGAEPLLFETMVFGGKLDQEQERYSTYDQAEAGHAEMVGRVKSTLV